MQVHMTLHAFTSFFYGFASIMTHGSWLAPALCLQMGFSVWNHGSKPHTRTWVLHTDIFVSHAIFILSILDAMTIRNIPRKARVLVALYWFAAFYTIWVYKISRWSFIEGLVGDLWHASIHLISAIAVTAMHHVKKMIQQDKVKIT